MRIGLLGAGGMGNVHAKAYRRMSGVELHVFERDPARAAAFAARWSAVAAPSEEALLDAVDAIDVCLPTDLHADATVRALEAGKSVFVEKPLAGDLGAADRACAAAARAGATAMVGHVVRYFPEFRRARELVRQGEVGRPAAIRTRRGGAAPNGSDGWFMDHARSGGVLLDLAIHDFDWLLWTFGPVVEVSARSRSAQSRSARAGSAPADSASGPDYALCLLKFESGAVGHVEATWMDPRGFSTAFEVAGSGGLLEYDSRRAANLVSATAERTSYAGEMLPEDDPYFCELSDFVAAAREARPAPVGFEDGRRALAVSLAAIESARAGAPVRL